MACYRPIAALQQGGSGSVRLWPPLGTANLHLPCGRCIGCKTKRATEWAHRCMHEAKEYDQSVFITLTYRDDALPEKGRLQPWQFTRFIKRIREHTRRRGGGVTPYNGSNVRYFACGEYGEERGRPHYHAILFGTGFSDGRAVGPELWESDTLTRLWSHGIARYGPATPAAANYIAQYSLKKIGGSRSVMVDGLEIPAPFLRMSTRPPIGAKWLERNKEDLLQGYMVVDGVQQGIPRTYKERLKKLDGQFYDEVMGRLAKAMSGRIGDKNKPGRLAAAEKIHERLKALNEESKGRA